MEDDSRKQEVSVNVEDNQNTAAKTKDLEKETKKAKDEIEAARKKFKSLNDRSEAVIRSKVNNIILVSGIISDCYKMHNFCMIKKFDTYIWLTHFSLCMVLLICIKRFNLLAIFKRLMIIRHQQIQSLVSLICSYLFYTKNV
ncbi:hypothetical protein KUTeg_005327 [Tegillarca granosa]|uniref:Uncharacterized protein n=1 Tax=Tegillarca granosa TaxID=220873 RepID=A0ABQ9FJE7_TEGGR|nr:hypothetical protein KUTeg_005327 [Tegillarca granosa]